MRFNSKGQSVFWNGSISFLCMPEPGFCVGRQGAVSASHRAASAARAISVLDQPSV